MTAARRTLSVTEAARLGVPQLVRAAEAGQVLVIKRRGHPAAGIVAAARLKAIARLEDDLRDSALVMTRMTADAGTRTDLDDAIAAFGLAREDLED